MGIKTKKELCLEIFLLEERKLCSPTNLYAKRLLYEREYYVVISRDGIFELLALQLKWIAENQVI